MRILNIPHALGFAVASLALPSVGCTESHQQEDPDTGTATADAPVIVADAGATPDVLLALDTPAPIPRDAGSDAPVLEDAGDLRDGGYPDGIRG